MALHNQVEAALLCSHRAGVCTPMLLPILKSEVLPAYAWVKGPSLHSELWGVNQSQPLPQLFDKFHSLRIYEVPATCKTLYHELKFKKNSQKLYYPWSITLEQEEWLLLSSDELRPKEVLWQWWDEELLFWTAGHPLYQLDECLNHLGFSFSAAEKQIDQLLSVKKNLLIVFYPL